MLEPLAEEFPTAIVGVGLVYETARDIDVADAAKVSMTSKAAETPEVTLLLTAESENHLDDSEADDPNARLTE